MSENPNDSNPPNTDDLKNNARQIFNHIEWKSIDKSLTQMEDLCAPPTFKEFGEFFKKYEIAVKYKNNFLIYWLVIRSKGQ
jgi:hypothetical protein